MQVTVEDYNQLIDVVNTLVVNVSALKQGKEQHEATSKEIELGGSRVVFYALSENEMKLLHLVSVLDENVLVLADTQKHFTTELQNYTQVLQEVHNQSQSLEKFLMVVATQNGQVKSVDSEVSRTVQELSKDSPLAVQEISREELVKEYLSEHPEASLREIERETGVPKSSVSLIKKNL